MTQGPGKILDLLDWKRRVFELYARVRATGPPAGWKLWRETRDDLFRSHPQTPLAEATRRSFERLDLFPYDPRARTLAKVEAATKEELRIPSSRDEVMVCSRVGRARFELHGSDCGLDLYWIGGYGGGLFLPFRDETSGGTTYGAGRYLLDTVKGADLGADGGRLVLDFNFAYNPSCAYDPRWSCPLAPAGNSLELPVEAGEKAPGAGAAG